MAKLDGLETVLDFLKELQPKIAAQIAIKELAVNVDLLPADSKRTSKMNLFTRLIATAIITASIFGATVANADTYRAGEFRITLGEDANNGRTYRGCDSQGNCINLTNGTGWRDGGYRGITWENGEYSYSISWREGGSEPMYLNIYKNNTRILRRQLVPIQ